jgi:hypothetical protein
MRFRGKRMLGNCAFLFCVTLPDGIFLGCSRRRSVSDRIKWGIGSCEGGKSRSGSGLAFGSLEEKITGVSPAWPFSVEAEDIQIWWEEFQGEKLRVKTIARSWAMLYPAKAE